LNQCIYFRNAHQFVFTTIVKLASTFGLLRGVFSTYPTIHVDW
jgi:hypothetical protein